MTRFEDIVKQMAELVGVQEADRLIDLLPGGDWRRDFEAGLKEINGLMARLSRVAKDAPKGVA